MTTDFMASPDIAIFPPNISENCCPYYCSPCCPGSCYPFSPPPPFELGNRDSDPTFSPLVIAIIGILASAFLLVFYYAILAKYCTSWDSFRSRMRGGGYNDSYEDEDHNLTPSNDSWPMVTVGFEGRLTRWMLGGVTQIWCGIGDWRFPYNLDIGCRAHFVSSFFACLRPNSRGSLCWALRCMGTIGLVLACYYRLWVIHLAKASLDK